MVLAASLSATPALSREGSSGRLGLEAARPTMLPGQVIVGYKRGVAAGSQRASVAAVGGRTVATIARRAALVKLPERVDVDVAIAELSADPNVAYAEPNLLRYPMETVPNDPSFTEQWGLQNTGQSHGISNSTTQTAAGTPDADMDVTEAWDVTQGDEDTVIAILDSGVDTSHPDLAANLWTNEAELNGIAGVDDDDNGYVDDVNGFDFAEGDAGVFEPNSSYFGFDHGTHVAGTAAAVADNATGVAGVCPNCKIMVLKVFEPHDTDAPPDGIKDTMLGDVASSIAATNYAIRMGAHVINGSLGAAIFWSRGERAAFNRAHKAGLSLVFAAGNENGDNDLIALHDFDGDGMPDSVSPSYPASYDLPGIISVAASNDLDRNGYITACALQTGSSAWPCSFTNFGRSSVDVSGPGVDVISTVPGGYDTFDGTSMAAPHVAGLVGLIRSHRPDYTPMQVKNALMNSVDVAPGLSDLGFFPGQPVTGTFTASGGRANAFAALSGSTASSSPATDGTIAGARLIRSKRTGTVAWPSDTTDVYKKKLTKGVRYRVKLIGPAGRDLDLVIYKPAAKGVWQLEPGCLGLGGPCAMIHYSPEPDATEQATFKARRTKVHYFQVSAYLLNSGSYTLKVIKL